ncbi:MAG: hypothetical protein M1826_004902 [Phylliscum demangeonii]|nr:MAG: hypothetical protein M1826_004902 [Phylliscum demangeonii]
MVLYYLHFASPLVLLTASLVAAVVHNVRAATKSITRDASKKRTGPNGRPLPEHLAGKAACIYVVSSAFIYSALLLSVIEKQSAPSAVHLTTWLAGLTLEVVLLEVSLTLYVRKHAQKASPWGQAQSAGELVDFWELSDLVIGVLRLVFLAALNGSYLVLRRPRHSKDGGAGGEQGREPSETTGLLRSAPSANGLHGNGAGPAGYGTGPQDPKNASHPGSAAAGWSRPTTTPNIGWLEYLKGYSVLFPYLWPSKSRKLQLVVVVCLMLVFLQRVVNILVPYQVGVVTDILSGESGEPLRNPWGPICLFIALRLLQGSSGLLGALRSNLWIPISQYSYQALSTSSFEHVHSLSLDFHLGKRTGEVLSALNKGASINTFLEQVTFQVLPMIVDLVLVIAYFLLFFDAYYALVIAIVTCCYMYITVRMAAWRADIRRAMINASREEDAVKNDSMVAYETVKYFNAEAYEFQRYRDAVQAYQAAEYRVTFTLSIMNVTQNIIFTLGLLVTCFIAAYQVTTGQQTVGGFVTLLTFMSQLQTPLNFFGTFYRSIQSAMINSERMLELFKEQPTVVDRPGVEPLTSCQGEIRFEDVQFSYDTRKPAVDQLNFTIAPGTTTALVGESGGGKSTVFRLLFRFYNAGKGRIMVDGHDVQDLSIDSLRRHIGVVPQDTVLFNETLMYNLKYANPAATTEMVYEACRAASIHDQILRFPDGYMTKVGERGLRLSGGEKQRVAIARTILKNPRIILLDEATAALDSETEQNIQHALDTLSKGRTMLVIAHRLSTITTADQILCLQAGKVVEVGGHHELLRLRGRYASMWKKQIKAEQVAEEARVLSNRADKLRRGVAVDGSDGAEGGSGSGSGSGSGGDMSENDGDGQPQANNIHPPTDDTHHEHSQ